LKSLPEGVSPYICAAKIQFYLTALTQNLKRLVAMELFLRELAIRSANMASWYAVPGFLVKIDSFFPGIPSKGCHKVRALGGRVI